ncbi:DNA repair protein rhp54 [Hordeum vulgare]|nr:DNA repair protein rhp54 [Hordeum vulgare]
MTIATAVQQEDAAAHVRITTRETLLYLGLNPDQHGLVKCRHGRGQHRLVHVSSDGAARVARRTATHPIPVFHVYPQASRLSGKCSPEVSALAPSTPVPAPIDLNTTPVVGGSSSGGPRKRAWEMPADMLSGALNLFDRTPTVVDNERANHFMESIIFKGDTAVTGGVAAVGYDLEDTQSQDDRGPFTPSTYDQVGMQAAFMQDQVVLDLDGFPLDHEFPKDYSLEEEDDMDIDGEPLFEDELANQAARVKTKRKSRRTKAYTMAKDKLLCECWRGIRQDPEVDAEQNASTFWTRVHREFHEHTKFLP